MAGFLEWIDARFCHHRATGGTPVTQARVLRVENGELQMPGGRLGSQV